MRAIEKRLRERIKLLEQEIVALQLERNRFRTHFAERFRWWIKLQGEQKAPSVPYLIEQDAKQLKNFTWWAW